MSRTHFLQAAIVISATAVARDRRAFLHRWSVARSIPYLDLTDAIHGRGVEHVYLRDNWHWNAAGHPVAAEELQKALLNMRDGVARR